MSFVPINTLLFGTSLFILTYLLMLILVERLFLVIQRRRGVYLRRLLTFAPSEKSNEVQHTVSEKQRALWLRIYIVTTLLVLLLYNWTGQVLVLGVGLLPFAIRSWLDSYRRKQLESETLNWLIDLRIQLPLHGSLLRTIQTISENSDNRLARATKPYLESGFQGDGLELLQNLASEFQSAPLEDLLARVKAATEGTLQIDQPFEHALERLRAEIYTQAREHQQRIPSRLTLLIFPVLLGPSIALLVFPLAARLIATISGAGF